jgi:hypothetical protein
MSRIRPRGESFSSSRVTYVGHAGRQKPQCTHVSIPACIAASGEPGSAHIGRAIVSPPGAFASGRAAALIARPRRGCRR